MTDYKAIAMEIVPVGSQPTLGQLRQEIAETLEREILKAEARQRESRFPELNEIRETMNDERTKASQEAEDVKKKLKARQAELDTAEKLLRVRDNAAVAEIKKREGDVATKEKSLASLMKAFDDYLAWVEGDGEVDDNGRLFNKLREEYRSYKGTKK